MVYREKPAQVVTGEALLTRFDSTLELVDVAEPPYNGGQWEHVWCDGRWTRCERTVSLVVPSGDSALVRPVSAFCVNLGRQLEDLGDARTCNAWCTLPRFEHDALMQQEIRRWKHTSPEHFGQAREQMYVTVRFRYLADLRARLLTLFSEDEVRFLRDFPLKYVMNDWNA